MLKTKRMLHVSKIRSLMEREDADGHRIPFSIHYLCKNGSRVDTGEDKLAVCIGVDTRLHRHTLKFLSGQIRQVRDVLIRRIDDTRIIVN